MRTRTTLAAAALRAASALLGRLAGSGRLSAGLAQDKKPEPPFEGKIGWTVKDSKPAFCSASSSRTRRRSRTSNAEAGERAREKQAVNHPGRNRV
jgi:hypothetical protein